MYGRVPFAPTSRAFFTVELFRSLRAAGASFVGWNGSVRFRQRGFLERWKGSVRFRLRCFLERWKGSVRFRLRCFLERWKGSVRFRLRCASFITGERDRVGGARRRAPNTPGSPCHPRRFAVPSAYRVRLRVGRDTASCLSRPQAASLRLAPASRERLGEGDGVQHPPR